MCHFGIRIFFFFFELKAMEGDTRKASGPPIYLKAGQKFSKVSFLHPQERKELIPGDNFRPLPMKKAWK